MTSAHGLPPPAMAVRNLMEQVKTVDFLEKAYTLNPVRTYVFHFCY